ncbi:GGDEF domain-containing protein [Caryophanon tenue]|uniref:GGDEF domain-containing protein n=1 Tax=Caryophanon tenue TaxID=33978 RepID=A0A1C0Y639_9BACL|nr:GGDEF domain-containing protein [Caryophanon tenue]OCS82630.1 hypothetical protein A6M13_07085 [Caryophanon tenue]
MKLAQLEEATALTHEVMAYLQTADVEILEYVEWHILQMAIAIEINDEQAVMRLRDIIAHLLPLLPAEYRRTRSYYEETIIAYYVRTGQVEAACQQYTQYIAYLQQVDVPEQHVRHIYEQWVDVAEREAVLHLEALQQYSIYLETCLSQKLEAEMATKTDSLTALIHKDTLTGSYTRHYLEQQGARFVAEGAVSVAVFDCDRFKRLNDTYGHVMGDTVLRIIATTLEAVMPPDSFLARYGGDEFVIVTKRRATDLITLFQAVQGQFVEEAPHLCISISMGIVESMPHETFSDIFVRADAALYEAKRQGRGRYVIA